MKTKEIFSGRKNPIRKETILYILFITAILIIRLWNISDLNGLFLFDDEIGYWSHAANWAGLSWTNVTEGWFSFGYSILLVPLFWITHNMKILYRMAIVLNALMGVVSFVFGKVIIQEIDEQCDEIASMFISFTASCYSAYIVQSNIAWAETFIYTWFMFIVWSAVKFFKRRSWMNTIFFTAACSFLYIIHNRCIVVLIAYVIVLCYMVIKRKIDWRKAVMAFVIVAGTMWLNNLVKERLSEVIWEVSDGFIYNDVTVGVSRAERVVRQNEWVKLLYSFFGKLWYLLTSTLMLAYFGGSYIVKKFISAIQMQKKDGADDAYLFYLFLSLFIGGTIAAAAIAMMPGAVDYTQSTRLDSYFYGRYSDIVSGALILFGLLDIMHQPRRKRWLAECTVGLILYLACGSILYLQIKDIVDFWINAPCVFGIYFTRNFSCLQYSGIVLVLYLTGSILFYLADCGRKPIQIIKTGLVSLIVVMIFVKVSQNAYGFVQDNQQYQDQINKICEIVNDHVQYPIYCIEIDHNTRQAIRSRVTEGNIKYAELDSTTELGDNFFVVMDAGIIPDVDLDGKEMYFVVSCRDVMLLAIGDELAETIRQGGYFATRYDSISTDIDMLDVRMDLVDRDYNKKLKIGEDLSAVISLSLKNDDNNTLSIADFNLSYHIYDAEGNIILWEGDRYTIRLVSETEVPVTIDADYFKATGEYVVEFDFVEEGVAWLSGTGGETMQLNITIE